ncbi:MAG: terminase small subunit [Mariniphaga sp.]
MNITFKYNRIMQDEPKMYTLDELKKKLNEKQKTFCHSYIIGWNTTHSYKKAYGEMEDNSAAVSGYNLLRNTKIQQYINFIKNNLEEESGISKLRNLQELAKIAYTNIADLHDCWIELTDWEKIKTDNPDALNAIESIDTKTETKVYNRGEANETDVEIKYVKIKLYSKTTALDMINKMLGYNLPEKKEITGAGGSPLIPVNIIFKDFSN